MPPLSSSAPSLPADTWNGPLGAQLTAPALAPKGLAGASVPSAADGLASTPQPILNAAAAVARRSGSMPQPGALPEDPVRHDLAAPQRLILQFDQPPVAALAKPSVRLQDRRGQAATFQSYADGLRRQQDSVVALARAAGIGVEVNSRFSYVFNGLAVTVKAADAPRLTHLPGVVHAYPDTAVKAEGANYASLAGAPDAWARIDSRAQPGTGEGIKVAVVDTGIDYTHPDLGGCFGPNCRVAGGYDFVNNDADPMDDNGHGTHVAGIIAASGTITGVAPSATLLAYKVLGANGEGFQGTVIAGLDRAVADGAAVINLSLGAPFGSPDDPASQAVDAAVADGVVVVVAAGNSGPRYQTIESPGVARRAITVGATDAQDQLAYFSARGPVPAFPTVTKPDITAPGVNILSTVPRVGELGSPSRYRQLSGTSMATPHVAGMAALLRQRHPDWTPELIQAALMNTAKDLGLSPYEQGAGRGQLEAAATSPLLATPGSLSFGTPPLNSMALSLTLRSVSASAITATLSASAAFWDDGDFATPGAGQPVTYPVLSTAQATLAPGGSTAVTLTLRIPAEAGAGYYAGRVLINAGGRVLTVPFTFMLLSTVTVHVFDERGIEMGLDNHSPLYMSPIRAHPVGTFNQDVVGESLILPAVFTLKPGQYHFYASSAEELNLDTVHLGKSPFLLGAQLTLGPREHRELNLSVAQAHRFTLDLHGAGGRPLLLQLFRFQFESGTGAQMTPYPSVWWGWYTRPLSPLLPELLPSSVDFYVSDSPGDDSVTFTLEGCGYSSPALANFVRLNSGRWYESTTNTSLGMDACQWADQKYAYDWGLPRVDASTATRISLDPSQTVHYRSHYNFPGTDVQLSSPGALASGLDNLCRIGHGGDNMYCALLPIAPGVVRDNYVRGNWYEWYVPKYLPSSLPVGAINRLYQHDWTRDWPRTEPIPGDPASWAVPIEYLSPLPPGEYPARDNAAGPRFGALSFQNDEQHLRLQFPYYGAGNVQQAFWGSGSDLSIYHNGQLIAQESGDILDYFVQPVGRVYAARGPGRYTVAISTTSAVEIGHRDTIGAGFTLPGADMDPPQVLGLTMPQRFAPGAQLAATLTVSDSLSGISDVAMSVSRDGEDRWTPLPVAGQAGRYSTTIAAGTALTVSLAYTVTDRAGNYLSGTTQGAALRETPLDFHIEFSPKQVKLTDGQAMLHLSGHLRRIDGQPISQAGLPIAIYVNDQLAGYVRDTARLSDGSFEHGTVDADWAFVPRDLLTSAGTASVRFVFDVGTYARQEQTLALEVVDSAPRYRVYLPSCFNGGWR